MKHNTNPMAICPFYKYEERSSIVCEGMQEDTNIHVKFGNPADRHDYEQALCCKDYRRCIWARALFKQYGE